MIENFIHDIPTKYYFGKDVIKHLDEELRKYGNKILLAYGGGSIKRIGLYQKIIDILNTGNFEYTELSGIEPNPRIESVIEGVKLCREFKCDVILAVGGGSTIDCAKAIASGYYYNGDLWEMVKGPRSLKKSLPLIDILTLSATGSEFDGVGVISNLDTNEKMGNSYTYPRVSFCDPTYTFSVSDYQTAAGSFDIMSHVIEGYFSDSDDSDLADDIAESILRTVMKYTPVALSDSDDYVARANLMHCSSIACSGIPEYGKRKVPWPCHSMEHELSAYYDITHGAGLAILTPRWMRYILQKDAKTIKRFSRFARNVMGLMGEDSYDLSIRGIEAFEEYIRSTSLPMTLTELGIDDINFENMALHANRNQKLKASYVPLDEKDIIEIYKMCI